MRRWVIAAVFASAAVVFPLRGGSFVWTGLAFDDDWETATNWRGGNPPPNDGSADLTLGRAANVSGGFTQLRINTSLDANSLVFSGDFTPYYIQGGEAYLTIENGITYSPTGTVDSVVAYGMEVMLARNQTWNIANGSLEIDTYLGGSGNIIKTGTGELRLYGNGYGYSGVFNLNQGGLLLGNDYALGTEALVINAGSVPYLRTDKCNEVTIANPVLLNGSFQTLLNSTLTFSGTVTLAANITIQPQTSSPLVLSGAVVESGGAHSLTVDGPGVVSLTGTSSYTGGTNVSSGVLIFGDTTAVPTTGQLNATGDGYIGIGADSETLQSAFINKFNKSATTGTIGLDTDPAADGTNSFSASINLAGFASGARLGSATRAIYYGTLTPQGLTYNFGGGGGYLEVESSLTDTYVDDFLTSRSLVVSSPAGAPLTVRLDPRSMDGTNTYTGGTTVTQSALIFASSGALPTGGPADLHLGPGGYIGMEDVNVDSLAGYLARFPANTSQGIIGFDTGPSSDPVTIGALNLMAFGSASFYLGTATQATLDGAISLPSLANAYRFAGYKGGQLAVTTSLSNNMSVATGVIIGDPDVPATANDPTGANSTQSSTVFLTGDNSYTGGTTLYAGMLVVGRSNEAGPTTALGSGALNVQPVNFSHDSSLRPRLVADDYGLTIPNNVALATDLEIGSNDVFDNDFTLAGVISGPGGLFKQDDFTVTLSGNNTFSGGVHIGSSDNYGGTVVFASDTAAGNGSLEILDGDAVFTSAHPVIHGLSGNSDSDPVYLDSGVVNLTINQDADSHYYGSIEASGEATSLIKEGSGRLYLESSNDYPGGTRINNGALIAGDSGSLGSGTITLSGGSLLTRYDVTLTNPLVLTAGTLGGYGTFDAPGQLQIGANVILAPGSVDIKAPGTLSIGASGLILASGGSYTWQIQSANAGEGVGWDWLDVCGPINVTATSGSPNWFTISLVSLDPTGASGDVSDFNPVYPYSWLIASAGSGITNFDASRFHLDPSSFTNSLAGGSFSLSLGGEADNELLLNFTPVPEPSTGALLGLGLAGLLLRCWRRRR